MVQCEFSIPVLYYGGADRVSFSSRLRRSKGVSQGFGLGGHVGVFGIVGVGFLAPS